MLKSNFKGISTPTLTFLKKVEKKTQDGKKLSITFNRKKVSGPSGFGMIMTMGLEVIETAEIHTEDGNLSSIYQMVYGSNSNNTSVYKVEGKSKSSCKYNSSNSHDDFEKFVLKYL